MLKSVWRLKQQLPAKINIQLHLYILSERREKHLEIKFCDWNEIEDKFGWGLGDGFLCFPTIFAC